MRLTRETMIKIARDTATQRAGISRRIICIYLTGSVLSESPLLGGTTDIDLVFVHDSEPLQSREIVRLSDDVHLDIAHLDQAIFQQPRHLRTDPWLGPFIYAKPLVLHDRQHWFDFTQASTGAQFFQSEYILKRANVLAQAARKSWMDLQLSPPEDHTLAVLRYLEALENAGNALSSLTGQPLTERRFLLHLPHRLQELNQPELIANLIQLLVTEPGRLEDNWSQWMVSWKEAFQASERQENVPTRLHPARQPYYERAIAALWDESPTAALWLLFRTWTLAAGQLSERLPERAGWKNACEALGLGQNHFDDRLHALDRYLDQVEETLEIWARKNGVSDDTDL